MAITSFDTYTAALAGATPFVINKASATAEGAGTVHSLWKVAGTPIAGSNPGATGVIPTNTTDGAVKFTNSGLQDYLGALSFRGATQGSITVYDRLFHVSGLSGTQTVVDTAVSNTALTRYTDGAGVELWAEFYTAIGASAATLTAKYTDQDGNTAQTATYAHPANAESVGQMVRLTLAAGDSGVRAVTNYHWSVTTGTAGDFGFTLVKPLFTIGLSSANIATVVSALDHGLTKIEPSACLAFMVDCTTTNTGFISGHMRVMGQ